MIAQVRVLIVVGVLAVALGTPIVASGAGADSCGVTSGAGVGELVSVGDDLAQVVADGLPLESPAGATTSGVERSQQDAWQPIDAAEAHVLIPPGERYEVTVSAATHGLAEVLPKFELTARARQAVERAPTWLTDALADNLRRLGPAKQDVFAQLVLEAEDPWVDEVAFQVARLAPASLTHPRFTPDLIVENAQLIYEHDKTLKYVDVVDHGTAAEGGDYYSTTRYKMVDGEEEAWVEIPKEMYYWFVVHPKLSDETVKKSSEADSRQATYGYFWRNYLFSNPDPEHDYAAKDGEADYYPVLGDVLALPTALWDMQQANLPKFRPFEEGNTALDVVGNWVGHVMPSKAKGNRPIQPNQIAYEHNGNCGEIQDLLGAAARTGLIPVALTSDHCEDHVWNEFFAAGGAPEWDGFGWHPYQVSWEGGPTFIDDPGIAYDKQHGGGKDVSAIWAFRSDGYIYDVVDRYSDACTLVAEVKDTSGKPVDGARVLLASEAWQDDTRLVVADWCYTDSTGVCSFRLGENQNYYMQVASSIGQDPPEENKVKRVIQGSVTDETYVSKVTLPGTVPANEFQVDDTQGDTFQLRVKLDVTNDIVYGKNLFGEGPDWAKWEDTGSVDVFLLDDENYERYLQGSPFTAAVGQEDAEAAEIAFALPHLATDWHLVFSNADRLVNSQVLDAEVTLLWDATRGPRTRAFVPIARKPAVGGLMP
jgi:hypothetical protein